MELTAVLNELADTTGLEAQGATPVLAGMSGNAAAIFSAAPAISYRSDSNADLPAAPTQASLTTAQYVPYVVMS